jgi:radical SAM enzyme (TIGR01210 family)
MKTETQQNERDRRHAILKSVALVPSLRKKFENLFGDNIFRRNEAPLFMDQQILAALAGEIDAVRECLSSTLSSQGDIPLILEQLKNGDLLKSYLSRDRQIEILQMFSDDLSGFHQYLKQDSPDLSKTPQLDEALWVAPATTTPITYKYESPEQVAQKTTQLDQLGMEYEITDDNTVIIYSWRLSFAFHKNMCESKKKCETCTFCDLSVKNRDLSVPITSDQQLAALEDALTKIRSVPNPPGTIEILPDGSFLSPSEVPVETQTRMMTRLAEESSIHRVAVETRPEHCTPHRVKRLLKNLRPEQKLNIYFGLETLDDFFGAIINKKGYVRQEFEEAVRALVEQLEPSDVDRLSISVYSIVKPVYLTEEESVKMSLQMAKEMKTLSDELGIKINVKYEPAIVSNNTLQGYLFKQSDPETSERRYTPLSYFAVAEIIALLGELDLHDLAKFGQRDDIDDYKTVAMITSIDDDSMFSPFDFMVYNAVQRFNTRQDLRTFILDMKVAIQHSPEFKKWEKDFYGSEGESALSRLFAKENLETSDDREIEEGDFQKAVWRVCDRIEYNPELSKKLGQAPETWTDHISEEIQRFFDQEGICVFIVKDPIMVDPGLESEDRLPGEFTNPTLKGMSVKTAYQVEVIILNEKKLPQSVWVKIPLVSAGPTDKPDFIYG